MMKKYVCLSFVCLSIFSCGGSEDSGNSIEKENTAPTIPVLLSPTNNKLCIDNLVNFQWDVAVDTEKNPISYQIQIAKDNQFLQIVKTSEGTANGQSVSLEKGMAYYWRVKAIDSKNLASEYSPTYNFYTEGVGLTNHLPFSPELVFPASNAVLNTTSVTLKWNASDVDGNDVLLYDVFFGTTNPPTQKLGENISATTLVVGLEASKNYYWRLVVKDNKSGETIGQVWTFKTN